MAERCQGGKHSLVEILTSQRVYAADAVVRWCEYCGAIVVDLEYDNRVFPGAQMPMRFSQLMKEQTDW